MIQEHYPLNENLAIPLRILIKIYFLFIVFRALINNIVSSWYLLLLWSEIIDNCELSLSISLSLSLFKLNLLYQISDQWIANQFRDKSSTKLHKVYHEHLKRLKSEK